MAGKKIKSNQRFMLKGSLKKGGFDRWRLVTCANSCSTGEERTFFIEYYFVNPFLSPDECILGFKSRIGSSAADLQYALAGTEAAKSLKGESLVQPSFVMVKAGVLGPDGGRHMNRYVPFSSVHFGKNECIFSLGPMENPFTVLSDDYTFGKIQVSKADLMEHPEYLCDAGNIEWDLRFDSKSLFAADYKSRDVSWNCLGPLTYFTGTIILDGEKFAVNPRTSFGYYDKIFGREFVNPFFHLHSSNFTSIISGNKLTGSCFAVQGEFNGTLSVLTELDGKKLVFNAFDSKKYELTFDCSKMPGPSEDGIKLHWTVSVHDKKYVLDIDVFASADSVFVRDYETPDGARKLMKVLGGANGTGELRLYKKIKKNLELIEHVKVENSVCEYGNIELPEL
ncbi:MAG: hypothetical protein J5780_00890 [Treponema sp.]|nr:hypothetical protein [Treponema sp.]